MLQGESDVARPSWLALGSVQRPETMMRVALDSGVMGSEGCLLLVYLIEAVSRKAPSGVKTSREHSVEMTMDDDVWRWKAPCSLHVSL